MNLIGEIEHAFDMITKLGVDIIARTNDPVGSFLARSGTNVGSD